ncbi:MAG: SDR family NAD(P)-dependent oxidoreductase [Parvularculaceae bacterium]
MADQRRLALVTGASAGIGTAFARLAAAKGCDVALVARRADRLEDLAAELRGKGVKAFPMAMDLCECVSADTIMSRLSGKGRNADVLINNAGYSIPASFAATPLDDQLAFMDLTMSTPVRLARLCLPSMIERGFGRIINISSITAFSSGGKGHTLYPAAKSFLVKFSQSLNAEVKEKGVRVSAICPGFVDTEFQQANGMSEKMDRPPPFMLQSPEEIAEESWRRNDKGVEVIVPGLLPKVMAAALKYLPEQIVTPLTRKAAADHFIGE